MEISKEKPYNPIVQDVKNNKPRVISYGNFPFNYGALPQTYEDPNLALEDFTPVIYGDNDPIDAVEIGDKPIPMGSVRRVKVIGCLGVIDQGEIDWKVLVIDEQNPLANIVTDIAALQEKYPNILDIVYHWFKLYKTADGKPENKFIYDGKWLDRKYAMSVINTGYDRWKHLVANGRKEIWTGSNC